MRTCKGADPVGCTGFVVSLHSSLFTICLVDLQLWGVRACGCDRIAVGVVALDCGPFT